MQCDAAGLHRTGRIRVLQHPFDHRLRRYCILVVLPCNGSAARNGLLLWLCWNGLGNAPERETLATPGSQSTGSDRVVCDLQEHPAF